MSEANPAGRDQRGDEDQPRRPRVLFVNRSYWPDVEATGQLLTELCEDLASEFDVHVLCGQPQQVADDAPFDRSGGSRHNGVAIHRVRHTRFNKASFWGRLTNMVTFQAASAWRSLRVPRPDVVVTETDPPFLCLLGSLLKRIRGCRLICYLQDIYPDVAVALGKLREGPKMLGILRRLFVNAYRRSDAVVVLSRDMRELLLDDGVPAEKIEIVPNWVDVDAVYPVKEDNRFRHTHGLEDKFVVMYSGNMGLSQRLDQVLEAAARLRDRDDIVFAMVGDGADRRHLERLAAERQLANVCFFGYQPKDQLADSLSAADLHLVILRPEIKQLLMPSKLYGVLASGTPALVAADADCELASIVAENDLGRVAPVDDPEGLAAAIALYCDSPALRAAQGKRAREYAVACCDRSRSTACMRQTLLTALGDSAASNPSVDFAQAAAPLAEAETLEPAVLPQQPIGAKQFVSTFAANVAIQVCTIVQGVLLARLLGPEGRGQFAGAVLWPSVFAGVGGMGMGIALSRRSARATDLACIIRSGIVLSFATGLFAIAACAAALPWLLGSVDQTTRLAAWCFLPFILFNHVALTLIAIDHGAGRFSQYNWTRLLINPVYLTLVVVLWLCGVRSAAWFVAALAAANGVVAALRLAAAARQTRGWGPVDPLGAVFREALPFGAAGLVGPFLASADKALLLYLLGETQLGYYAVALTAASVLQSLSQAAAAVSFGMSAQSDASAAFDRVACVFRFTAWSWAIGGAALALAMPLLLPLVYGSAFASAIWPAIVLILPVAFAGQAAILEDAMRAQGRAFVGLEARTAGMAVFVAVGWFAAARWGLIGVAMAFALGQAVVLAIMLLSSRVYFRAVGMQALIPRRRDLHELLTRIARRIAALRASRFGLSRASLEAPAVTGCNSSIETK